jgi:hypothetical protein
MSGKHTKSDDSRSRSTPDYLEMLPGEEWLAEKGRRRPLAAAMISLRQCRKTATMNQPLQGKRSFLGIFARCHGKNTP